MAKIDKLIANHPLRCSPYDKLEFVRLDGNRIPLYRVEGVDAAPTGAFEAIGRAFARYGGKCFYCPTKFKPQPLSTNAHRDHVIATSNGGSDLLHIWSSPAGSAAAPRRTTRSMTSGPNPRRNI